jgi:hypothetical protein
VIRKPHAWARHRRKFQADEEPCARQVVIVEAPRDQAFGHRTCFFRDSEGNVLEICAEI